MKIDDYRSTPGPKTRILNIFRRLFMVRFFENILIGKTLGRDVNSFWVKLIPSNYLYEKNSRREAVRSGVKYSLDISDYLEHAVYFGYREKAQEELFRIAENMRVIIDVGVNIGSTLLNFARICPEAEILGFEPDADNYRKASKNIQLNAFDNLELINKGLGSASAAVRLFKVNEGNAGMNRILPERDSSESDIMEFTEIEIVSLDDFLAQRPQCHVDLIKIDVEGYELQVLRGAEQTLEQHRPTLFIELDDDNLRIQGDSAELLVSFLTRFGYRIFRADDEKEFESGDQFRHCHFDIIGKAA